MAKPRKVHHLQAQAPTEGEIRSWIGNKATDEFGRGVGKVEEVYREGEELRWLLIRHRRSHHFLAPVANAVGSGGMVWLAYTQDVIESAPQVQPGSRPSDEALAAAAKHYKI